MLMGGHWEPKTWSSAEAELELSTSQRGTPSATYTLFWSRNSEDCTLERGKQKVLKLWFQTANAFRWAMTEVRFERGKKPREVSKAHRDAFIWRVFAYSKEVPEELSCSFGGLMELGVQKLESEVNYSLLWAWKLEDYILGVRMNQK